MKNKIYFFNEDIVFNLLYRKKIKQWLINVVASENKSLENLNYIFCSDEYLLKLNIEYLKHYTLTDIITFNNSNNKDIINGDIFIRITRVKENAIKYNQIFYDELLRVIVHGVLHLCGYKDKLLKDRKVMREKEDYYLLGYKNL